ncbi:ABC transporter family substrate-binding protein [Pseudonocardiaceae bacterium YIM PH 21723]|nr:ABC transporter family substrate-binding protein [Pseudonocardiaceae bacterium YIM PH 21723]
MRKVLLLALVLTLATACTNAPPPQVVPPEQVPTTTKKPSNLKEITVGMDTAVGGLNPHRLADNSMGTRALASLVLPSVFRTGPDGVPRLDPAVATSAQVTGSGPFQVTYTLRREATWQDGAPIAAEDFVYLAKVLSAEPGVIDPAGYRLISGIDSRDGGKTVIVNFSQPYPGWRSLFTDLLPAHLLKDAPGGWSGSFNDTYPTSGGQFSLKNIDRERGEIVLERNDRYWDTSAGPDRILLRRSDPAGVVSALRNKDTQLAVLRSTPATAALLGPLADTVSTVTVPAPVTAQLLLRPASPQLTDVRVRNAIAALLDRNALINVGTEGNLANAVKADAQFLAPKQPGYGPTIPAGPPATPDPAHAAGLLTEAGYQQVAGVWTKAGKPLSLVIAAPAGQEQFKAIADNAQQQLSAAGVPAKVVTPNASELFGTQLVATGDSASDAAAVIDLAVVGAPVSADPATGLASWYGCRTPIGGGKKELGPPNLARFCDPALQGSFDAALTGAQPLSETLSATEAGLWGQWVVIPLFQLSDTLVVRPEMAGVEAGPLLSGPFAAAAGWLRKS